MRYAYLGPRGTFTQSALGHLHEARHGDHIPYATVSAALAAVREGMADAAMVPLENSVEGGVSATMEELVSGQPLHIVAEVCLRVEFALMAEAGTRLQNIENVITHPHAAMQCRGWLRQWLPRAVVGTAASTGAAARQLAETHQGLTAAIAPPVTAALYGLEILAHDIGDRADAVTRFILVKRPSTPSPRTGADRTSIVAIARDEQVNWLAPALNEFLSRGLHLTRIESRPRGDGLGRYNYLIDCEGHVQDPSVEDALSGLKRHCADVRFLGSYPRGWAQSGGLSLL